MDKNMTVIITTTAHIKAIPSADAVEVVRCKDCRYHHYENGEIPYCERMDYGYGLKDDDFCSKGERKDNE